MLGFLSGHRPDITPAQFIGFVCGAAGPVCALVGIHLSPQQLDAVDNLRTLGLGLFGADAAIRIGRNHKDGKVEAAALANTSQPPDASITKTVVGPEGEPTTVSVDGKQVSEVSTPYATDVPEEAPFSEDEIDSLPPEVSSDPEADAIDSADLPSDDEEDRTVGPSTPTEVQ